MSDLFTIDCHACGAKNTIDTETMRRVDAVGNAGVFPATVDIDFSPEYGPVEHPIRYLTQASARERFSHPEDAA